MVDIAYVILNYKNCNVTFDCVDSIREYNQTNSYCIVIVDNESTEETFRGLSQKFGKDNDVSIIRNIKNLGFAKGNNTGIRFAHEHFDIEYICVLNSDVKLLHGVLDVLREKSRMTDFAVLGPMILSGDGRYDSSPMADHLYTKKEIIKEIRHSRRVLNLNHWNLWKLYQYYQKIKPKQKTCRYTNEIDYLRDYTDYKLHGCCLFFSNKFFDYYDGFCEQTFLYFEEDILLLNLKKVGLHSLYTPKVIVYHAEDASTLLEVDTTKEKVNFIYSNRLKSQIIYQNMIDKM